MGAAEALHSPDFKQYAEHFSILHPDFTYRTAEQLDAISQATGEADLRALTTFKPERQVFQWTVAHLSLYDEACPHEQFQANVKSFTDRYLAQGMPEISARVEAMRSDIERRITAEVDALQGGQETPFSEMRATVRDTASRIQKHKGMPDARSIDRQLLINAATDQAYMHSAEVNKTLRDFVHDGVKKAIADDVLHPTPLANDGSYRNILICAGPGSGKSTLANIIGAHMGGDDKSFLHISFDKYRRAYMSVTDLKGVPEFLPPRLVHDEVIYAYPKVMKIYQDMLKDNPGKAPKLVVERACKHGEALAESMLSHADTTPTYVYFMHVDTEEAMKRAFNRARTTQEVIDKHRYVPSSKTLQFHQELAQELVDIAHTDRKKNITFEELDNMVAPGQKPKSILFGNTQRREINVLDTDKSFAVLKKLFINKQATAEQEIYPAGVDYVQKVADVMKDLGKENRVRYANQRTGDIYAEWVPERRKLVVYDEAAFREKKDAAIFKAYAPQDIVVEAASHDAHRIDKGYQLG